MTNALTLAGGIWESEIIIQKSRFHAYAQHIDNAAQAQNFIKKVSRADATHNCYAWLTADSQKYTDNGEPTGTAGLPILQSIKQQHLTSVAVVVVRDFGGIKLGTGGLARAYGQVATDVLSRARKEKLSTCAILQIIVSYPQSSVVERLSVKYGQILSTDFRAQVHYEVAIPLTQEPDFLQQATEQLRQPLTIVARRQAVIALAD